MRNFLTALVTLTAGLVFVANTETFGRTMTYQAVLFDSTGGTQAVIVDLGFKIYDSAGKSGSNTLLWQETHLNHSVAANGSFTVELGSLVPMPDSIFEGDLWLEIVVEGEPITPRTKLTATPFSFSSRKMEGDVITSPGKLRVPGPDSLDWLDLTTTGFAFPTKTDCWVIPPCGGWVKSNGADIYTYNCTASSIYAWSTSGLTFSLFAEVRVPVGATITGLQVYVKDSHAAADITFKLHRHIQLVSNQPQATQLASVSSSGSGGTWQLLSVSLSHPVVSTSTAAYVVEASIPAGVTISGLEWGQVRVCYSINTLTIR